LHRDRAAESGPLSGDRGGATRCNVIFFTYPALASYFCRGEEGELVAAAIKEARARYGMMPDFADGKGQRG